MFDNWFGNRKRQAQNDEDLQARVRKLVDERDTAVKDAAAHLANVKRLAAENTRLRAAKDGQDLRRRLFLSEGARARLDTQCVALQSANEALCREAVDRAGTLAKTGETE